MRKIESVDNYFSNFRNLIGARLRNHPSIKIKMATKKKVAKKKTVKKTTKKKTTAKKKTTKKKKK